MTAWRCIAHVVASPPTADWRDVLARRLGKRPRRIGLWAELAIFGARACLDAADEPALPDGARLRVASLRGAVSATQACVAQGAGGLLPMPFSFMQSQPSQMLAALGVALGWQGDASFVVGRDNEALRALALRGAGPQGVLFGWVEQSAGGDQCLSTAWWRMVPE